MEVIHAHSPAARGASSGCFRPCRTVWSRNYVWLGLRRWRRPTRCSNAIYRSTISVSRSRRLSPRTASSGAGTIGSGYGALLKTQRRLNADSTVQHEGQVYLVEDRLKAQTVMVTSVWTDRSICAATTVR